jgi:hypothetical protein
MEHVLMSPLVEGMVGSIGLRVHSWLGYHNRNHDSPRTIQKKFRFFMPTGLLLSINLNLS